MTDNEALLTIAAVVVGLAIFLGLSVYVFIWYRDQIQADLTGWRLVLIQFVETGWYITTLLLHWTIVIVISGIWLLLVAALVKIAWLYLFG